MRNVAKRMLNQELASCVLQWKQQQKSEAFELQARARGERIMQRVAGRWRNKEVTGMFLVWRSSWRAWAEEERGLGIMRRVGARMTKKDVVFAVASWRDKANKGVLEMVGAC